LAGGRCGVSAMVCHSEVYHGSLLGGFADGDPGCVGSAAVGGS